MTSTGDAEMLSNFVKGKAKHLQKHYNDKGYQYETWLCHFDPESKAQSSLWKTP